ncbi:MAG TPA: hypothetical protein DGG95_18260 [Cytophagales bacterium]|jgi:putative phosphoribosyl transferase|nr:hypothetical protein [Cytophagales bacterium]
MISTITDSKIKNRKHAAQLVSQQLKEYHLQNGVVVAVPPGGAAIGFHVARELGLPLIVISCKEIEHPRDSRKSIGSVCEDEKVIHNDDRGIPADYISNQINRLQHSAKVENDFYNAGKESIALADKTVILIIDKLSNADALLACINCIKKEKPLKIIVAVALAKPEAANIISGCVDEFLYLHTDAAHFENDFDTILDEETQHFFKVHDKILH